MTQSCCYGQHGWSTGHNLGQEIYRLFQVFAVFFSTNEAELDYYYQEVNLRVAPKVTERLKT